ncbi:MAG TPA: glycoside hydrolase 43 family protein [Sphaerochaeta sp.]|nr:glycoside hydrolase 43 family protein [Sphaerochaeta sp.]
MTRVQNPILKGFNPDPSILRVGDDYFIATSTFEWFPGVQIHHSKDLVNWTLLTRPLDRVSQLDMKGCLDSTGVWAPCLSYDKGTFYLLYTIVHTKDHFKDTHNYLVTAPAITGPWSEPVYINSYGFDPSLFHDDDGRKYVVTMSTDFRKGRSRFAGILLEEFDMRLGACVGNPKLIFKGTELGWTEGPHLYHIGQFYYLLVAEGGTFYNHAESVARSKHIEGPYEEMPGNPLVTSRDRPDLSIQKAGHADLVQMQNGEWAMVHLCGRPVDKHCMLGRETSIQNIVFDEDLWPRIKGGGNAPRAFFESPFDATPAGPVDIHYSFDQDKLPLDFQTLRIPLAEDTLSLKARKGYLRLYGKESPNSTFTQALVGRRQQAFRCIVTTKVEFDPSWYKHMAGLSYYYGTRQYYYLRFSHDEALGKVVCILSCDNGKYDEPFEPVALGETTSLYLRIETDYGIVRFFYSLDGERYIQYGQDSDALRISDDRLDNTAFTGAFFTLSAQDMTGFSKSADFAFLHYTELE